MSGYHRYMREFERSVASLTSAMDGMQREHALLKQQFRTYVADHETFAKNVRKYLDELDIGDEEQETDSSPSAGRGQNDNEQRLGGRLPNLAGE